MQELIINVLLTIWAIALSLGVISFYIPHPKAYKLSMLLGIMAFIGMPVLILFVYIVFIIWG